MPPMEKFTREYELDDDGGTLQLEQVLEGDVNCVVWDAALVLAKYLELQSRKNGKFLRKRKVIELGSGLGCVGLAAACLGADVTLTDRSDALSLLERNISLNEELVKKSGGIAMAKSLDWSNTNNEDGPYDVILLADCIYYHESIEPLVTTLSRLSTKETEILLCQEDRSYSTVQTDTWKHFLATVKPHFQMSSIHRSEQNQEYSSSDIFLVRLTKID